MKPFMDWLGASLFLALVRLRLMLTDRGAGRLARAVAWLALRCVPSRRRIAERNIKRAFGATLGVAERARILEGSYLHFVSMFADLVVMFRGDRAALVEKVEVRGLEHLRSALAAGKGVVGVNAHFGGFPLICATLPFLGIQSAFLMRRARNPRSAALFDRWFGVAGCRIIDDVPRPLAALRCLRALKSGAFVGLAIDQRFQAGVPVPFFGHPAMTGVGAALLSARSGAPLVPMVMSRVPGGEYRLTIEPAIPPPADSSQESLVAMTARLTRRVEEWIREDPAQWFWIHRRWKDLDATDSAR